VKSRKKPTKIGIFQKRPFCGARFPPRLSATCACRKPTAPRCSAYSAMLSLSLVSSSATSTATPRAATKATDQASTPALRHCEPATRLLSGSSIDSVATFVTRAGGNVYSHLPALSQFAMHNYVQVKSANMLIFGSYETLRTTLQQVLGACGGTHAERLKQLKTYCFAIHPTPYP
jgi:hypothetical protein